MQIQTATQKAQGTVPTAEEEAELLKRISERYERQMSPYYAASRLWVDEIIDPAKTRQYIARCLEVANHAPIEKQFNPGVFQV